MSTLYVLQLEDDKWYVGKTDDIQKRFEQHKNELGSEWTKLYKPMKIYLTKEVKSIHDENNVTKDFMKKYGIDNVRGGAYTQLDLSDNQYECLIHELRCISDCCFKCGISDHFAGDCDQDLSNDEIIGWICEKCESEFPTETDCEEHEKLCKKSKPLCQRCGRNTHNITTCIAKTHIKGHQL